MKLLNIFYPFFEKYYQKYYKGNPYKLAMTAIIASIIVSSFLGITKLFAYWITNSVAIRLLAIDSFSDAARSVFMLIALFLSSKGHNSKYSYGYGKIESCAVMIQSMSVLYFTFLILYETFHIIVQHEEKIQITNEFAGSLIIITSIISLFFLISFQKFITEKTNSLAVKFDCMHYKADFFINIGAIFSLFLSQKYWFIDIIFTVCVCLLVLHNLIEIFMQAIRDILDASLPVDELNKINEILTKYTAIKKINYIQTRSVGINNHININLSVNENCDSVNKIIDLNNSIKHDLMKSIANANVLIEVS